MTPRYGQLAYTSFDQPGGRGGWQVKQTTGDLSPEETQRLASGVRTAFRPVAPLPDYPTPEQLDAAPRRLEYRRWAGDAAGYWHTVAAGADSTGRPGNVFAHVLLDRAPDSAPRIRPIQRWASPVWLHPFGAAAVARAALPADPPGAAQVVTRESAIAFALDTSTWRVGTLLGLLDAVAAALDGGAPVALGVVSVDSAAQWIGLVSFLMSPGTAATMNFSTFDRADQLGPAQHAIQHLAAVPVGDLDTVPAGFVVIDETATLSLGELGGEPHRTAAGQAIDVTAWSVMAQEALLDPQSALAVLDELDHRAAQTQDRDLHPAWPLAVTIAADAAFAAAHPEANAIITAHSPAGIIPGSPTERLVDEALSALVGHTTPDAWKAAEQNLPGFAGEHAALTYLCRAIGDDTWLDQLGPIPVGGNTYHGRPVPDALADALGLALQRASASGDPQRLLKLVDLLLRAGIDDDRLTQALTDQVAAQLADPHTGPTLARRLTHRLAPETRIAAAAATLRLSCEGATAISDAVLEWFADGSTMPSPGELLGAQPWDATWTRAAVCGMRAERNPGEANRFAELWWLTATGSPRRDELAARHLWDPAQLAAAGGAALSTPALLPTLLAAPDSESLTRLADEITAANHDDLAVACAALRMVSPAAWVQRGYINTHQKAYARLWDMALGETARGGVHVDCAVRVTVLAVLGLIAGQPRPVLAGQLAADPAVAGATTEQVLALVDNDIVTAAEVLAANLLRTDAAEPGDAVDGVLAAAATVLAASRQFSDDDQEGVLAVMMRMAGSNEGTPPRRYRKLVATMLARRGDGRAPLTAPPAQMWRDH
ncbi:putative ESX-1 scaffolding and assembly protein SaeB [Mycobacterium mantenii]|uniref:ESX-1 scaffolding and assembly protein SaeB n=1 Tax=Mycobacterium mantenii TaxID=560555 RepID=A0A1X0FB95_MYCNT|nr:hypothetical protein [Mycobacterium mantenii]MCV7245313.1 hypothetical protein [Mycobacterium mantenii]ORA98778.1 hypothetical protein BST30_25320 [Mycobacterium mantenii]BBY37704.1 putative ESX-1 scaffolding and assembly protein SaeB [Mycobacterium mantenii]